ncbi:MAG: hypothetical protein SGJ00_04900 [bacterium]|nr:hypothetical protein [bacterium]
MRKLIILLLVVAACKGQNKATFTPDFVTGPPTIVYKTKADYRNFVPVLLSDDKSEIISYPHPSDIKVGEEYAKPSLLKDGYLLDNRGVGQNVAFLNYTYEAYAKLEEVPSLKDLYAHIVDKDPLLEMCNCGSMKGLENREQQLNKLIDQKKLRKVCKVIK